MDGPETYRLFVALSVPDEVKEELRRVQNQLRGCLPDDAVRWTRPEQIHLTLKFFEKVQVRRIDELADSVRTACEAILPFRLSAGDIGFFPEARRPRIIWAGVKDGNNQLDELQRRIDASTAAFSIGPKEEAFAGHLTIGRIRRISSKDARALNEAASRSGQCSFGRWTAASIEIIRSQLTEHGSRYSRLREILLST